MRQWFARRIRQYQEANILWLIVLALVVAIIVLVMEW